MFIPPEVEEYAIHLIHTSGGIKGTDLVLKLGSRFLNADNKRLRLVPAALALDGKVMEIEYIIAGRPSQSLFLPKGTEIRVKYDGH